MLSISKLILLVGGGEGEGDGETEKKKMVIMNSSMVNLCSL